MRFARLIGLLVLLLLVPAISAEAACVSRFANGISQNGLLSSIAAGPDGNMWFGENGPTNINRIARVTPTGGVTEFSAGISPSADIEGIMAGPDGNLWFTENGGNRIGRITPGGVVSEFSSGISGDAGPESIAAGSDGNLWFTELFANQIGRITPTGQVTEFPTGSSGPPWSITKGPDGNMWFIDAFGVGRITPAGVVTRFNQIGYDELGRQITTGPDGNLWVTEYDRNQIGRITPTGQLTEFSQGISSPQGITAGQDGNLWFVDNHGVERITPTGQVTSFSNATGHAVDSIAAGPDGTLWFQEAAGGNAIGRLLPYGSCPRVRIWSNRASVSKRGKLALRLQCGTGQVGCTGTLTLTIGVRAHRQQVASTDYSLPAHQTSPVVVTLTGKGLKLLQKARNHRLVVTAQTTQSQRTVTLRL